MNNQSTKLEVSDADGSVREYLRAIGRKGGAASKGKPSAKERAKKAAAARWSKRVSFILAGKELRRDRS